MVYLFGEFRFDTVQGLLFRGETIVSLKPKSIAVLGILLENHGQIVPRKIIMPRVWGEETFVEDNNLDQCIAALRRALGGDRNGTQYIQTVFKRGFRFVGNVTVEAASDNIRQEIVKPATEVPSLEISPVTASSDRTEISGSQPKPSVIEQRVPRWYARLSLKVLLVVGLFVLLYYFPAHTAAPPTPEVLGYTQLTNDGRMKGNPILTDGVRAYLEEYEGSGMVMASISAEGEEISTVRLPAGFLPTDVWPDGSKFLGDERRGRTDTLAVALPTGKALQWLLQPPAPSGRYQTRVLGSWSPHGGKIALCYGHSVFEAHSDGSGLRRLTTLPGWPSWLRWSPDGRVLSFTVLNPKAEKESLWEIGADGTHLHPLDFRRSRFSRTCFGIWTSDGKYFIFQARQDGHDDIWALRERGVWLRRSGARLVRLTSGPLDYRYPVPSRNRKVIFALGAQSRGELMRFDLKSHTFTEFLGGISAAEVSFSRDGKWVAYVRYPDYTLWRARADGSDAVQLTFPPLEAREPRWSPDGTKIAFQGITQGPRYKIYVISRDGGEVQQIIPGDGEESVATWSPGGQSLVYDEPLYRHDPSQMFIYRLDLKTGKTYKIPGSAGSWTARLSPDGRYIATLDATTLAHPRHLYVLEASTGQRILAITMPDQISEPTWSRDGKYVYFATLGTPAPALYRIRVRDKELEKLVSLGTFPVAGLWTGVAPDGSPLLLRNTSTEELYALHVRLP